MLWSKSSMPIGIERITKKSLEVADCSVNLCQVGRAKLGLATKVGRLSQAAFLEGEGALRHGMVSSSAARGGAKDR